MIFVPFPPARGNGAAIVAHLDSHEGVGWLLVPQDVTAREYNQAMTWLAARGWQDIGPEESGDELEQLPDGRWKVWLDNEGLILRAAEMKRSA